MLFFLAIFFIILGGWLMDKSVQAIGDDDWREWFYLGLGVCPFAGGVEILICLCRMIANR